MLVCVGGCSYSFFTLYQLILIPVSKASSKTKGLPAGNTFGVEGEPFMTSSGLPCQVFSILDMSLSGPSAHIFMAVICASSFS